MCFSEDGEITDTNLRDVVLNFLIAGRDTTANVSLPPPYHSQHIMPCHDMLCTSIVLYLCLSASLCISAYHAMTEMYWVVQALSWAVYRLCIHPHIQDKVYEEARLIAEANHANSGRQEDPHLDYNDMMSAKVKRDAIACLKCTLL